MKVAFRTDASLQIGTGHVMRCLTLAKALDDRGAECTFLCRDHEGNLIEKIRREGFECVVLAQSAGANETQAVGELALAHADWLGTSWQCDARETISAIGAKKVDWLIVDHYALDKRWEDKLRPYAKKIMVIDDIADRPHDCDFLLDQNLVANFETRYQHLLPDHCATFLGPQYALLHPAYAELQTRTPPRMGSVQRILVFFGGGDQNNLTARAVSAFGKLKRHDIVLDVVMSSHDPNAAGVQAQAQQHANINVHGELPSLAPLMLQVDLAVGGSGATSWERCCLGLPSLVITLADNQKPIAAELEGRGLVRWLGHYDAVADDMLIDALKAAIDAPDLNSWSLACMSVTDGLGVERVASALALNSETKLKARLTRLEDEALLLRWANDPLVRANAFNPEVIPAETHRKWFYERLRDPENCKIYIIETDEELPIGQVRFERVGGKWEIHYSLALIARGFGLGKNLLKTAIGKFRIDHEGAQVFGCVKQTNLPSQKIFEDLGFAGSSGGGGEGKLSIAICSDPNSWINDSIPELLLSLLSAGHSCVWAHDADDLHHGDLCFYLSYGRIVSQEKLGQFQNNLVVHASDLPEGRGWSPASWMILEGKNRIPITLIEALCEVDSGPIYDQIWLELDQTDLIDVWHSKLSEATASLVCSFVSNYPVSLQKKRDQQGQSSFYYRRRPLDSQLDATQPFNKQFNLLRIVDNESYPAFFQIHGSEFVLKIYKRTPTKH